MRKLKFNNQNPIKKIKFNKKKLCKKLSLRLHWILPIKDQRKRSLESNPMINLKSKETSNKTWAKLLSKLLLKEKEQEIKMIELLRKKSLKKKTIDPQLQIFLKKGTILYSTRIRSKQMIFDKRF